jgi:hypothetical protein
MNNASIKNRRSESKCRKSFLWHPNEDTARAVELICEQCDLSANAVITQLAEYGLKNMRLQPRTVQEIRFGE